MDVETRQVEPRIIRAPEFERGPWLNSQPLSIKELRGRVVLVDFWDFTCVNCLRTLPYLVEWYRRYHDKGLEIIGVHSPEFSFAQDAELVAQAAEENGIAYPVLLDNDFMTWRAYANRYWPAKYLIDQDGYIRHRTFGEGRYAQTEEAIQVLLRELNPNVELPEYLEPLRVEDVPGAVCYPTTPELYGGYERGRLGNREGLTLTPTLYRDPGAHEEGYLYLDGEWRATPESVECVNGGYAALKYRAAELNAVLRAVPPRQSVQVTLTQNGSHLTTENAGADVQISEQGVSFVVADRPRLYNLVRNPQFGIFEVKLSAPFGGLGIYAFTFVSCTVLEEELGQIQGPVLQVE
jgi:thiol-disulfide isomerase/thioredoxin